MRFPISQLEHIMGNECAVMSLHDVQVAVLVELPMVHALEYPIVVVSQQKIEAAAATTHQRTVLKVGVEGK